jgi:L-fuculose-phosphate aldolase
VRRTAAEIALRKAIARVCRRLWERGLVAGQDGNVSARLGRARIVVTPSGYSKVDVTPADLVVLRLDGSKVSGMNSASSEIAVHLRAYARRPDVGAVVHAHPPTATGFALAGQTLPERALTEVDVLLGPVPLVPYGTPGTTQLADRFEPFWTGHDAFLMANHGALTLGPDLRVAHQRMETLEHAARVVATARGLGHLQELEPGQLRTLRATRARRGAE